MAIKSRQKLFRSRQTFECICVQNTLDLKK